MAAPAPTAPVDRRLVILALGLTQVIGFGTSFYILSVLADSMARDLALSRGVVLGGLSLWLIVSAALGPRLGRWQDEEGARRVMMAGSILQGLGLIALALSHSAWMFFASWAVLGLAAPLALYTAAFTALTQIDARNARRAISALTFLGGLASTVFWPLTSALAEVMDWRAILLLYAALNLVICLPIHARVLGEARGNAGRVVDPGESVPPGLPYEAQNVALILFGAMLTLQALVFYAVTTLVFPMLGAFGFSATTAILTASIIGPAQVAGRVADMMAASRVSALTTGTISALLLPLAFGALVGLPAGLATGVAFAAFYGMSNGLLTIARGGMTLAIFGSHGYGERFNRIMMPQNFIGALAPVFGGALVDAFGAATLVPVMLALALASAALMVMLHLYCAQRGLK